MTQEWKNATRIARRDLLLSGNRLKRAVDWQRERKDDFSEDERAYIQMSNRAARRQRIWRVALSGGAVVAASVAVLAIGVASYSIKRLAGQCPPATSYTSPSGSFKKEGSVWNEYNKEGLFAQFKEIRQDQTHIYLADPDRKINDGRDFIVRIPKCGGTAEWTWSNPLTYSIPGANSRANGSQLGQP